MITTNLPKQYYARNNTRPKERQSKRAISVCPPLPFAAKFPALSLSLFLVVLARFYWFDVRPNLMAFAKLFAAKPFGLPNFGESVYVNFELAM